MKKLKLEGIEDPYLRSILDVFNEFDPVQSGSKSRLNYINTEEIFTKILLEFNPEKA